MNSVKAPFIVEKEGEKPWGSLPLLTFFAGFFPYNSGQKEGGLCIMNCT